MCPNVLTECMEVYLQGEITNRVPSALGRIERVEAGWCQGWDSCALIFKITQSQNSCLCFSPNQIHCCTPGKDWIYKPDLLPELALGQLLWIYELSWVILLLLTDEMFSGGAEGSLHIWARGCTEPVAAAPALLSRGGNELLQWESCSVCMASGTACPWPGLVEVAPASPGPRAAGGQAALQLSADTKGAFAPLFSAKF